MHWLIVEDALRDRKGHWFEWVSTFYEGFRELGDQVTVLSDSAVLPEIREPLDATPILPGSIWHRMSDGASAPRRYSRLLTHGWKTWCVMRHYLRRHPEADTIFVPTVLPHHLLGWAPMIKTTLRKRKTRILLFFLTGPFIIDPPAGRIRLDRSPSSTLLIRLLKWLEPEVRTGKVVLGVETEQMRKSMAALLRLPFMCFPQPVRPLPAAYLHDAKPRHRIEMACFGGARAEKGSDVLQQAISLHRKRFPYSRLTFTLQWIDDFTSDGGRVHTKSLALLADPQIRFLTRYFVNGEYTQYLTQTQVMLLPYRLSSYQVRGSRVVIEAVVNGIPVIVTRGTTLADVVASFGAGIQCEDGDPQSLCLAIQEMDSRFEELSARAQETQTLAARHFSVAAFREGFSNIARTLERVAWRRLPK